MFLHSVEPTDGNCFCNDDSEINATSGFHPTSGFHQILEFMESELRRLAPKAKGRKREVEVAHGDA